MGEGCRARTEIPGGADPLPPASNWWRADAGAGGKRSAHESTLQKGAVFSNRCKARRARFRVPAR
jgi:hypothetical protein